MYTKPRGYYCTADEKHFLDALGTKDYSTVPRLALLQRYQAAIQQRRQWGSIDAQEVHLYLWGLIAQEAKRQRKVA